MDIIGVTGANDTVNFCHTLLAMLLPDNDGFHVVIAVPIAQKQNTLNVYKVVTLTNADLVVHKVFPHCSMNSKKGVIQCWDLTDTSKEYRKTCQHKALWR